MMLANSGQEPNFLLSPSVMWDKKLWIVFLTTLNYKKYQPRDIMKI